MNYYLAIDIGASSGRHILGHVENGKLVLEEVFRFDNLQKHQNGHDCWDMDNLWNGILGGLKACKALGKLPTTVGIDTWGVDFVLLDEQDQVIGDAVAYRDARTEGMQEIVSRVISPRELYSRAGIQYQPFNTIYQLTALKQEAPEQLEKAKWLLMIPEYFNFRLTGVKKNEYTNNTTGNLINAHTKTWDYEVIEAPIAIEDVMKAGHDGTLEEIFGTGTAAVVSPVKELDWKGDKVFIGDGKIGPVTQKLYDTMTGIQWGKIPDTKGWIDVVCKA